MMGTGGREGERRREDRWREEGRGREGGREGGKRIRVIICSTCTYLSGFLDHALSHTSLRFRGGAKPLLHMHLHEQGGTLNPIPVGSVYGDVSVTCEKKDE